MAYITAPYLNATLALSRLSGYNKVISQYNTLKTQIASIGMSEVQAQRIISNYKTSLLNYFQKQTQRFINESVYHALAAATESDNKNSLLAPIMIVNELINPAAIDNEVEQVATLASGVDAGLQLANLINEVTQLLS